MLYTVRFQVLQNSSSWGMETSSKDASRAKYKLSQSRKRIHAGRGGKKNASSRPSGGVHIPLRTPLDASSRDYDLSDDEKGSADEGEDFGKLLADATKYSGTNHRHRQDAMIDALLAPLNSHTSQVTLAPNCLGQCILPVAQLSRSSTRRGDSLRLWANSYPA